MSTLDAFIAANRFGLGARPGELADIARDPRGWIASQISTSPSIPDALADMPPRTVLAGCVLTHLLDMLPRFSQQGFAAFRGDFDRYDAVKGELVQVQSAEQVFTGKAAGVLGDGALRVETPNGVREVYGGEVSLRVR